VINHHKYVHNDTIIISKEITLQKTNQKYGVPTSKEREVLGESVGAVNASHNIVIEHTVPSTHRKVTRYHGR
jgi:hypothetical protein